MCSVTSEFVQSDLLSVVLVFTLSVGRVMRSGGGVIIVMMMGGARDCVFFKKKVRAGY